MSKPELHIIFKDITRPRVTISKDRFDLKIPTNIDLEEYEWALSIAKKIMEDKWEEDMSTYRTQIW